MNSVGKIDLLMGVLNLLPNPVYIKNADHVWIEANAAFCHFLGYSREELIGRTDHDYFPKEQADIFWEMDNRVLETRQRNVNTERNSNAAGDVRWVESSKSYFEDADGNAFIIGVLTDVTEMKEREVALEEAQQQAMQALRSRSEFLANMSHEIRTPMNGVLGMSQILRRSPLSDEQTEIVGMIERSGEALLTIINDILDFSKIEAGKFEIDPEPFALATVVDDVATLLASGAADKAVELITDTSPALPEYVVGDAGRIRQILTNLVGNAIKFTASGHVLVKVSGEAVEGMTHVSICVEDTGIGIPADKLDTIFRQFEQADSSTTRRFGGTGLGLSICRSLVDAMGGEISVSSVPGKGSIFRVELALPVAEEVPGEEPPAGPQDLSHVRALVIDDIGLNCRIVRDQLAQHHIRADCETDPREGLRRLAAAYNRREPYDLLVLDYQMPGIDGLKVLQLIRSKPAFNRLKIVALSSVDMPEVKNAFVAAGISAFLVKPLRNGALGASVASAFAGVRPRMRAAVSLAPPEVRPAAMPGALNTGRILIAEDNEVNQRVMAGLLSVTGHRLDFAANGQIAVDLFRHNDYSLVLMDVSMPVMDGMTATGLIREYEARTGRPPTPILAVTAHALKEEQASFLARGVDQVLTKPIDHAQLTDALQRWIGGAMRQVA